MPSSCSLIRYGPISRRVTSSVRSGSFTVVNDGTAPAVAERTLGSLALRAISALAMAPVAVGAILLGSPYFDLLVALGCGVLAWEWRHLCGDGRFGGVGWLLMGGVLAVVAAAALGLFTAAGVLALSAAAAVYGALART